MRRHRLPLMLLISLLAAPVACAGQGLVSTKKNVSAYMDFNGYHITPVGKMTVPGDLSDAQIFEINRPGMGPITLGRLFTSCTCIQASTEKRKYARGETATITLRNVRPTTGQTYPFYVQVTSPIRATLRYDTWVISDQFVVAPPVIEPEPITVTEAVPAESVKEEAAMTEAVVREESPETIPDEAAAAAVEAVEEPTEPVTEDVEATVASEPAEAAGEVFEPVVVPAVETPAEPAPADEVVPDKYSTVE